MALTKRTKFVVSLALPKKVTRKEMGAYISAAIAEYRGCLKSKYACDDDDYDHVTNLDPDTVRVSIRWGRPNDCH